MTYRKIIDQMFAGVGGSTYIISHVVVVIKGATPLQASFIQGANPCLLTLNIGNMKKDNIETFLSNFIKNKSKNNSDLKKYCKVRIKEPKDYLNILTYLSAEKYGNYKELKLVLTKIKTISNFHFMNIPFLSILSKFSEKEILELIFDSEWFKIINEYIKSSYISLSLEVCSSNKESIEYLNSVIKKTNFKKYPEWKKELESKIKHYI